MNAYADLKMYWTKATNACAALDLQRQQTDKP